MQYYTEKLNRHSHCRILIKWSIQFVPRMLNHNHPVALSFLLYIVLSSILSTKSLENLDLLQGFDRSTTFSILIQITCKAVPCLSTLLKHLARLLVVFLPGKTRLCSFARSFNHLIHGEQQQAGNGRFENWSYRKMRVLPMMALTIRVQFTWIAGWRGIKYDLC